MSIKKIAGRAVYEVHGSAPAVGKRDRGQISGQAGKLNDAVKQRHRPAAFLDRYIVPQRIAARTGQVGHPVGNVRAQRGFLLKIQRAAKLYALCAAGEHGAVGQQDLHAVDHAHRNVGIQNLPQFGRIQLVVAGRHRRKHRKLLAVVLKVGLHGLGQLPHFLPQFFKAVLLLYVVDLPGHKKRDGDHKEHERQRHRQRAL